MSQWARLDPTFNKRQGSCVVRGRGCVPVGQAYIPKRVYSNVKMFADDTKIFRTLKNKSDCEILQADLNNL